MAKKLSTILVLLTVTTLSSQDTHDNNVEDPNPLAEIAATLLKNQNAENIGSMISSFMQSGGGKQLGDMLTVASGASKNNDVTGQILEGLGSMMSQNSGAKEGRGSFDPSMIGSILSLLKTAGNNKNSGGFDAGDLINLASNFLAKPTPKKRETGNRELSGFDPGDLLSLATSFFSQPGNAENFASYIPMVLQTLSSFAGPEAEERAREHSDHAWFVPPVLEKLHIFIDQFMHSEMGKNVVNMLGAEKFVKIFSDDYGKFSYAKFVELLENQSFRRHWIQMVTNRISHVISFASNPKMQKKYFTHIQHFFNNFLKTRGFSKAAFFDPTRPSESITAFVNEAAKKYFHQKIDSREYVQPVVEYAHDLIRLGQTKGYLMGSGLDSRELSSKLTDTINLEIIEPIARVNRAYRFAKKIPQCENYVMCLVNQEDQNDQLSLPGLKTLLSRASSVVAKYFLGSITDTSFDNIFRGFGEYKNCKEFYLDACNDFHIEEVKVTTEYVHSEL